LSLLRLLYNAISRGQGAECRVYGLGAGIFFIGYFLFEVPSNLLLDRIGARKTLLRIMVLWGLAASAMMFVSTPLQFYIVRFLLGVFEAGFFPGVILYFTYWYPSARRGQVIAIFMSATTIGSLVAGPLCGFILKYYDGLVGLYGWQWLFLAQGLPAIFLGLLVYLLLKDKPDQAPGSRLRKRRWSRMPSGMTLGTSRVRLTGHSCRCCWIRRLMCWH
jgi:MFS family permease